jgi:maltose alpha-D-glucosyltransferase / alpha-amylase
MNDAATAVTDTETVGLKSDDPMWYKDAVIYQLNVKSFFDSNDDGIGDFKGLTSKLDYIKSLGVNTI